MSNLAEFQQTFATAIAGEAQPDHPLNSPAFAIYRNTAALGIVEALRAGFPTIDALLGDEMFTGVALDFRQECPPAGPVLSDYGADFPAFLSRQPWTCELPYLADVARLDRLWLESFLAGNSAELPSPADGSSRIHLHPAARVAWLSTPALTIWQAHREPQGFDRLEPDWCEEGALFTRPGLEVRPQPIDRACHYLLLISATSPSVEQCVAAVAEAYPRSNVPGLLQQCVAAGALIIR
jgi:hypothetical protein